jgi:hypothetical protein
LFVCLLLSWNHETMNEYQRMKQRNGTSTFANNIMDQELTTTMTAPKDRKDNNNNNRMNEEEECEFDEKPFPKRSSVVEMWRKREGAIKSSSNIIGSTKSTAGFKFEENKQEDDMVEDDGVDTSDRDTGGTPQMISSSSSSSPSNNAPRVVTPERSGPEDESGSNVDGSTGSASGLVRRSNVRDAWKKRNINTPSSATKPTVAEPSMIDSPVVSPAQITWKKREIIKEYGSPDSVTKGPNNATSPSFIGTSQSRDSGASSDQPSTGTSTGSSSAFDELRSKWAKFGVQKSHARESITTRPQPTLTVNPSNNNNDNSSSSLRGFTTTSANTQSSTQRELDLPPFEEAPATPQRNSQKIIPTIDGVEVEKDGMPTPHRNPEDYNSPQNGTTRKSHLVRLGQKHAARPKSSSPSRELSPLKRNILVKDSPKQSPKTSAATDSNREMPSSNVDTASSSDAQQENRHTGRILHRAMQRRKQQHMQALSGAGRKCAAVSSQPNFKQPVYSGKPLNQPQPFDEDTFPLDEIPDEIEKSKKRNTNHRDDEGMIQSHLHMRTSFGSQSDDNSPFGTSANAIQRPMMTTEVSKARFNDWSEIESFPEEDQTPSPIVQRNQVSGGTTSTPTQPSTLAQPSNSSITDSALKKIREKRQKRQSMSTAETGERHERSPLSTSTSGVHSAVSFDGSAAVSQSMCSETSHMQSTYASGFSTETPTTTTANKKTDSHYPLDVVPNAKEMIPDEFVSEKNASVQSFQSAYERMSLEQIAKDMQEEASSVLKMDFLNNEYLNKGIDAAGKGINAAGMSLHQLVGGDIMFQKKSTKTKLPKRAPSPVEEVAIEVEYIADSDDDAYGQK